MVGRPWPHRTVGTTLRGASPARLEAPEIFPARHSLNQPGQNHRQPSNQTCRENTHDSPLRTTPRRAERPAILGCSARDCQCHVLFHAVEPNLLPKWRDGPPGQEPGSYRPYPHSECKPSVSRQPARRENRVSIPRGLEFVQARNGICNSPLLVSPASG